MMKLDTRILDYISHHRNGVLISEMEIPLGETRMKLGFVTNNLLEDGKIIKIENYYFPKVGIKDAESNRSNNP